MKFLKDVVDNNQTGTTSKNNFFDTQINSRNGVHVLVAQHVGEPESNETQC